MAKAENASIKLCRYYRDNNGDPIVLPPKTSPNFKKQLTHVFEQVFPYTPHERYWHVLSDPTLKMTEHISRLMQWDREETISSLGYSGILLRTFTKSNLMFINSKFPVSKLQTPERICIDWMIVDPVSNTIKLIDYCECKLASEEISERLKKLETNGTQLLKHLKCLYPDFHMDVEIVILLPANTGTLETTNNYKYQLTIWTKDKIEEQQTDDHESPGTSSQETDTRTTQNEEIVAGLALSYQHCMFEVLPLDIIPAVSTDKNDAKVNLKDFKSLTSVFENQKYLSTNELTTFPPIGAIPGCTVYENDDKYIGEVQNTWEQIYDSAKTRNKFPVVLINGHDHEEFRKFVKIEKRFTEPELKFEFDWLYLSNSFAGIIEVCVGSKKDTIATKLKQVIQRHIPYLQLILFSVANELSNDESVSELLEKKMFSLIRLTQLKVKDIQDWIEKNQTKINEIVGDLEKTATPKVAFWTNKNDLWELTYNRTDKRWSLGQKMTLEQQLETIDKVENDLFRYMMTLCSLPFVAAGNKFLKHVEKRDKNLDERHSVNKNKFLKSNKLRETAKSYLDLTLSPEQYQILNSEPSHLVLYGEAGTGKTTLLFALIKKKHTEWKNGELADDTKVYFIIDQSKYLFREFVSHFINENKFRNFVTIIEFGDLKYVTGSHNIFISDECYIENYQSFADLVRPYSLETSFTAGNLIWFSCVLPSLHSNSFKSKTLGFFTERCLTTLFRSAIHISRAALKLKHQSLDGSKLSFASPTSCRSFYSNQRFIKLEQIDCSSDLNQRIEELKNKKQIEQHDCLQIRYPEQIQANKLYFTGIEYNSVVFYTEEVPRSDFKLMLEALYLAMTRAVSKVFIFCAPSLYDCLRPLLEISEAENVKDQILAARFDPLISLATYNFSGNDYQDLMNIAMLSSDVNLLRLVCDSYPVFDFKRYPEIPPWLNLLFLTEKSEEFLKVLGEFQTNFKQYFASLSTQTEIPDAIKASFCYASRNTFRNVILWALKLHVIHHLDPKSIIPTCLGGNVKFLKEVLNFCSSVFNSRTLDYWQTPIHGACLSGNDEMIKYVADRIPVHCLVQAGKIPTPLTSLCTYRKGSSDSARYLVDAVKRRVSVSNALEMLETSELTSPLIEAVVSGALDMCKTIVELYSSLLTLDGQSPQKVKKFVERRDKLGSTALLMSIAFNRSDILKWLVNEVKCSFFDLDESLYEKACLAVDAATIPVLALLNEQIGRHPDLQDRYPNSPIVKACYQNERFEVARYFFTSAEVKAGLIADVFETGNFDDQLTNLKMLYLGDRLFELTERSSKGATLLHDACRVGNEKAAKWIVLQDHSLLELRDNRGFLPVHYLLSSQKKFDADARFQLFKWLVESIGQDTSARDGKNNNLAHYAVFSLNLPCYNYLVEKCPKLFKQRNEAGKTPDDFYNFWLSRWYPIRDFSVIADHLPMHNLIPRAATQTLQLPTQSLIPHHCILANYDWQLVLGAGLLALFAIYILELVCHSVRRQANNENEQNQGQSQNPAPPQKQTKSSQVNPDILEEDPYDTLADEVPVTSRDSKHSKYLKNSTPKRSQHMT